MKHHHFIRKSLLFCFSLFVLLTLQNCKSSKRAAAVAPAVSYEANIRPIMVAKCEPCHFPDRGRKKLLDTYAATVETIDDIMARVQMAEDEDGFMPFRSKKDPLTADEIMLFKQWIAGGMQE